MRVVTSDYLEGIRTHFRAIFNTVFAAGRNLPDWASLAMPMPSDGEQNTYPWFGTTPKMQNVSKRQLSVKPLNKFNFTIVNEEWQAGIEVERAALERDQLGLIEPRIQQLGQEAARHPGELVLSLFPLNPLAFDGTAFFADTRLIGNSANIDNLLAGSGVTVSAFQTDLGVARSSMRLFQDDEGRPMNLIGNVIVVPAGLEQVAYQAINADQGNNSGIIQAPVPATAGPIRANGYQVLVNPFLTDVNDWYLCHDGGPAERPFVWQEEKEPELSADTDPNSRPVIEKRSFLYSVDGRYNAGVADPRYAVKTVNS